VIAYAGAALARTGCALYPMPSPEQADRTRRVKIEERNCDGQDDPATGDYCRVCREPRNRTSGHALADGRAAWRCCAFGNRGPFRLIDQAGQTVTEKSLIGKPSIVFFGFTHCPDVCPTALFEMSEVLRAMGSDAGKVNAYFVSVDPERDTPAAMKDYLSSFDPNLKALTGTPEEVAKIISAYRVYAKKIPLKDGDYTMDHTALIYLMDRNGNFVRPFNLKRTPEEAAAELKRYL
jgi:protein SCO1/2